MDEYEMKTQNSEPSILFSCTYEELSLIMKWQLAQAKAWEAANEVSRLGQLAEPEELYSKEEDAAYWRDRWETQLAHNNRIQEANKNRRLRMKALAKEVDGLRYQIQEWESKYANLAATILAPEQS